MALDKAEAESRAKAFPRQRKRVARDLTGFKVNDLEVIGRADDYIDPKGQRGVRWLCRCVCGNTCVKSRSELMSGEAKSCGCSRSRSMRGKGLIDLTGKKFGRWTVLGRAEDKIEKNGHHRTMWHCVCECGTEKDVSGSSLRSGGTLSCGCLKLDTLTKKRDLVGRRFGRLVVTGPSKTGVQCGDRVLKSWDCVCDCGRTTTVAETSLLRGQTKSCGCLKNSYNEECFALVLDSYGLSYETQVTYDELHGIGGGKLRYDFRVDMGHPVLVELNGAQHYSSTPYFGGDDVLAAMQLSDETKASFAKSIGVPLHVVDCSNTPTRKEFEGILADIAKAEGMKLERHAGNDESKSTDEAQSSDEIVLNPHNPISMELVGQMVDKSCSILTARSSRKIAWRCEHGHVWEATVGSRTAGAGCPYCSGRFPVVGENDLGTLRPDLAAQLVRPEEAKSVTIGSGKRLEWRCKKDPSHTWFAPVKSRVGSSGKPGSGCPYCSGHATRSDWSSDVGKPLADKVRAHNDVDDDSEVNEVHRRLCAYFGEHDVEQKVMFGINVSHVISRDLYVVGLLGLDYGWHWLGETNDDNITFTRLAGMRKAAKLRDEMRRRNANLVVFWDARLWDMDLWFGLDAPDGRDWERSYSWLEWRDPGAIPLPRHMGTSQSFTTTAKHYQHECIFANELAIWKDDAYLDCRRDRRRVIGAFYANRYHYVGKLPDELSASGILRGIRIAGYANAYSRYDAAPMMRFLFEHPSIERVADPCAGWGERALACSMMSVAYEGVDVNMALAPGYDHMLTELDIKDVSVSFEDAADHAFGPADAVITCPPYMGVEKYSEKGAENLPLEAFESWWERVVARISDSGCKWVCITTNQACRDIFATALVDAGFEEISSEPVGKNRVSHFNRSHGGGVNKHEFEEFVVFERRTS